MSPATPFAASIHKAAVTGHGPAAGRSGPR
jgi:hypothetical protein